MFLEITFQFRVLLAYENTIHQGDPGFDRQTSYTAIVEDIPPGLSTRAAIRAYMEELFQNEVMNSCTSYLTSFVSRSQFLCVSTSTNNSLTIIWTFAITSIIL